jgi:hypothetical protein
MKKRHIILACFLAGFLLAGVLHLEKNDMARINFDLGKNIKEAAKASDAPRCPVKLLRTDVYGGRK